MKNNFLNYLLLMALFLLTYAMRSFAAYRDTSNVIDEKNDNVIHTTIYHNDQGKTLAFLVTFDIGNYDDKKACVTQKRRVFKASHPDGDHALTLGHHLANEYGPKLYHCVHEKLTVINGHYPDESMTYTLINNGKYYTAARPNNKHVYFYSVKLRCDSPRVICCCRP